MKARRVPNETNRQPPAQTAKKKTKKKSIFRPSVTVLLICPSKVKHALCQQRYLFPSQQQSFLCRCKFQSDSLNSTSGTTTKSSPASPEEPNQVSLVKCVCVCVFFFNSVTQKNE